MLRFMLCCGPTRHPPTMPPPMPPEEDAALGSAVSRARMRENIGRHGRSRVASSSMLQWRPSLCTIKEDDVALVVVGKHNSNTNSKHSAQQTKTNSKPSIRVSSPRQSSVTRQEVGIFQISIPTFAPSPLLFWTGQHKSVSSTVVASALNPCPFSFFLSFFFKTAHLIQCNYLILIIIPYCIFSKIACWLASNNSVV